MPVVNAKKSKNQAGLTKKKLPLIPCRLCKSISWWVQNGFCVKGYGHRKNCNCPSRQCMCECSVVDLHLVPDKKSNTSDVDASAYGYQDDDDEDGDFAAVSASSLEGGSTPLSPPEQLNEKKEVGQTLTREPGKKKMFSKLSVRIYSSCHYTRL